MEFTKLTDGDTLTYLESSDKKTILLRTKDELKVFGNGQPGITVKHKGAAYNTISNFFFDLTHDDVPNAKLDIACADNEAMMRNLRLYPVKFMVYGYITGPMWDAYTAGDRTYCGEQLPEGLKKCEKLPVPIFAPQMAAPQNREITFEEMATIIEKSRMGGIREAEMLRQYCLKLYEMCSAHCEERGIIVANAEFTFSMDEYGNAYLTDRLFTPDIAEYWPKECYHAGNEPPSYDKQLVIDAVREEKAYGNNNPRIPQIVLDQTQERIEALAKLITG